MLPVENDRVLHVQCLEGCPPLFSHVQYLTPAKNSTSIAGYFGHIARRLYVIYSQKKSSVQFQMQTAVKPCSNHQ